MEGLACLFLGTGIVNNSGDIAGTDSGIDANNSEIVNAIGGTITGGMYGIRSRDEVAISNAGTIEGGLVGIRLTGSAVNPVAEITNSGLIRGADGINSGNSLHVINTGRIDTNTANGSAIFASSADISNAAGAVILGDGFGLNITNSLTVNNAGDIQGTGTTGVGISADSAAITNSGTIFGVSTGILATSIADVVNTGTVFTGVNGFAISGATVNLTNFNSVAGGTNGRGVNAAIANVTNYGVIAGRDGINATVANVTNAGSITGAANGTGVQGAIVNANNSGTISGGVGIKGTSSGATGSSVTNSGTVIGTSGVAIQFGSAADTLTLLSGSKIVGVVDMGLGNDIVNVVVAAPATKVSSLTTVTVPTFINFTGTLNTSVSAGGFNGPTAQAGTQIATLDPTALAQTDRTLMDLTGGVSSLVQDRFNGASPLASGGLMAMAYAPDNGQASFPNRFKVGGGRNYAAPLTVWTSGFGKTRAQDATDTTLHATSSVWGGVIGIDRKIQPNWLVGAFLGVRFGTRFGRSRFAEGRYRTRCRRRV